MSGKKSDLGPTGVNVTLRAQVQGSPGPRLRRTEPRLAELGREIPSLGLRRIEAGERRVDADDLVALALALDVTPLALLLPARPTKTHRLAPGATPMPWQHIWVWATGQRWLSGDRSPSSVTAIRSSGPKSKPP